MLFRDVHVSTPKAWIQNNPFRNTVMSERRKNFKSNHFQRLILGDSHLHRSHSSGRLLSEMCLVVVQVKKTLTLNDSFLHCPIFFFLIQRVTCTVAKNDAPSHKFFCDKLNPQITTFFPPLSANNVAKLVVVYQHVCTISALEHLFSSLLSLSTFINKPRVNKLWSNDPLWPIPSFWVACELRVVSHLPLLHS